MSSITQLPTSFIDNLDDDCLSEIFAFANLDWKSHKHGTRNMFSISQVSRRWRDVALSRAELWSTMIINQASFHYMRLVPGREIDRNLSAVFPTASLMLKRSRQHPLEIYIELESSFRLLAPHIELLTTLLLPHVHQISRFCLLSSSREHQVILTNMFAGKTLPLLRCLQIIYTFASEKRALQESSDMVSLEIPFALGFPLLDSTPASHPNLKELMLQGIFCDWTNYSARHNLTTLVLGKFIPSTEPTAGQVFGILKTSKDTLRNLTITSLPRGSDAISLSVIVEFPCLEYLALIYSQPFDISRFVNQIRVPALKKLDIIGRDPDPIRNPMVAARVYTDTLEAFQHVMDNLPLSQIEEIHLDNLCFGPAPGDLVPGEQLPVPYRFFQCLKNVRHAELKNPSRYLLDAANYHLVGQAPNVVVMPELRNFKSMVRSEEALKELATFLRVRKSLGALDWDLMELKIPIYLKEVVYACPEIRDASVPTSVSFFCGHYEATSEIVTFGPSTH